DGNPGREPVKRGGGRCGIGGVGTPLGDEPPGPGPTGGPVAQAQPDASTGGQAHRTGGRKVAYIPQDRRSSAARLPRLSLRPMWGPKDGSRQVTRPRYSRRRRGSGSFQQPDGKPGVAGEERAVRQ